VLEGFEKAKIPRPDGWMVNSFWNFFDIMGPDILDVVEESRVSGVVYGALNATFIALTPKEEKPETFSDFLLISLCNLIYKIITKIINNRIKPMLSKFMTKEQFGFLDDRQILDAIGVSQESIHNIKSKKMKALIMNIDLMKAYDRVNWDFLRLVLLQVGLSLEATNWIMGCVTSTNFVVLINGAPTEFFKSHKGLRQGCPMSPFLFMLIVEGLSRLIKQATQEGRLVGIKISSVIKITHLLFVDDVLIFGKGSIEEWSVYKEILELFCSATGMMFSESKSSFMIVGLEANELTLIKQLLPFKFQLLDEGFKYLGFFLKPNSYLKSDWLWLLRKVEKRINSWCNRWLSLGGRFILVKSVLQNIPVFWLSLAKIPRYILDKIRQRVFTFCGLVTGIRVELTW
jgi:hypothetical protein